jgi:hypothetical protein
VSCRFPPRKTLFGSFQRKTDPRSNRRPGKTRIPHESSPPNSRKRYWLPCPRKDPRSDSRDRRTGGEGSRISKERVVEARIRKGVWRSLHGWDRWTGKPDSEVHRNKSHPVRFPSRSRRSTGFHGEDRPDKSGCRGAAFSIRLSLPPRCGGIRPGGGIQKPHSGQNLNRLFTGCKKIFPAQPLAVKGVKRSGNFLQGNIPVA